MALNIEETKKIFKALELADTELKSAEGVLNLYDKKGYSVGKWYKHPSVQVSMAYQATQGANNYHNSSSLDREFNKLIVKQWDYMVATAISRLKERVVIAEKAYIDHITKVNK